MAKKALFWVKFMSDDFKSISMQALKMLPNRYELNFLYDTLLFESISNQGVLVNEQIELLSTLFLDMDFEKSIETLGKLKLITIQENEILVDKVYNNYESIQENSIKRQEQRKRQKETMSEDGTTKDDNVANETTKATASDNKSKVKKSKVDIEKSKEGKSKEELEIENKLELKKKKKKENKALLEKDALDVYNFYRQEIKPGGRKKTIENLIKFLSKHSKQDLIKSISNYSSYKKSEGVTELKFIKAPENFFSQANEIFVDYLSINYLDPNMQKEINALKEFSWFYDNGKFSELGLEREKKIKEKYGIFENDSIEVEFKVIDGGK